MATWIDAAKGLLYQLTEKRQYEVQFYIKDQPVKSITVDIGDGLVNLGDNPFIPSGNFNIQVLINPYPLPNLIVLMKSL